MRVPPRLVRRLLLAPVLLVAEGALVVASPVLALAARLLGGARALRAVMITVESSARHAATTIACLALWIASGFGRWAGSARLQRAHYRVLRWFVGGVYRSIVRMARVDVRVEASEAAQSAMSARSGPVVVLSLHAGEGDSLLVLHQLLCRYRRRPRVVLHEALRLDPVIDVLGERLPNRFVDPRGGDTEVEIAAMAADAGPHDAVLIFPEGGNFSAARRARGIERLEEAGHDEEAGWAREMTHVTAPRPGGALAALESAPQADVVFVAHAGIPVGARELWHRLAGRQTVDVRMWLVPAAEIPTGRDQQIDWLFAWWRTLDHWVRERDAARAA
jgi:1-acyl-sn-glycerol-3-phosphate acyltransferase